MLNETRWFTEMPNHIMCVPQMLKEVEDLEKNGRISIWFRGQTDFNDQLLPTIGREHKFVGEPPKFDIFTEWNLLQRFRRYAYLEFQRKLGEWEALFLARHHGLPVRLLDWTSSPLIALYFAAATGRDKLDDAAVWAFIGKPKLRPIDIFREEAKGELKLKSDDDYYQSEKEFPRKVKIMLLKHIIRDKDLKFEDLQPPLRLKGVRVIYPFYASPRMIVQNSAFTIQDNPWKCLESYFKCKGGDKKVSKYVDIDHIIKWKVPKEARWPIIDQLERAGINYRTLYPDLDGLAKWLWHLEVVRANPPSP